jgi:DNA polymerase-3 subunit delta'
MDWPRPAQAAQWLAEQGVPAPDVEALLRAAGGRPEDALAMSRSGVDARQWSSLPKAIARGDASPMGDWAPARVVDGLLKLCHDLMAIRAGAAPRFFQPADLPRPPAYVALAEWSRELARTLRTVEHPYNGGLMLEALVSQGRSALNSAH